MTTTIFNPPELQEYWNKIDKKLKKKYELVAKRLNNDADIQDCLVLFEANAGCGKTNHSIAFCKIEGQLTNRHFDVNNIFFDAKEMIERAKKEKAQIYLYDEPALQGLKKQFWNKIQIQLSQLLFMARKKRHLIVFNIIDFTKFAEFIIRRANFMVRLYKKKQNESNRHFLFYPERKLLKLNDVWIRKRYRSYMKYHTIHGNMPNKFVLPLLINENKYEELKDKAIMAIGEDTKPTFEDRYKKIALKRADAFKKLQDYAGISNKDACKIAGLTEKQLQDIRSMASDQMFTPELEPLPPLQIPVLQKAC